MDRQRQCACDRGLTTTGRCFAGGAEPCALCCSACRQRCRRNAEIHAAARRPANSLAALSQPYSLLEISKYGLVIDVECEPEPR